MKCSSSMYCNSLNDHIGLTPQGSVLQNSSWKGEGEEKNGNN